MSLSNLKIGTKLRVCFGILIAMLLGTATLVYVLGDRTAVANSEAARINAITTGLKDSLLATRSARGLLWYYVATGDEQAIADYQKAFAQHEETYGRLFATVKTETSRAAIAPYGAAVAAYKEFAPKLADLRRKSVSTSDPAYQATVAQAIALQKAYAKTNEDAVSYYVKRSESFQAAAKEAVRGMQFWPGAIAAFAVLAAVALAWTMNRNIVSALVVLTRSMTGLAKGDLDIPVEGTVRRDEVGLMASAVQVFKEAAVEQRRLEAEAVAAREAQALSRDRQAAIDTAKAEDLRVFAHAVEAGFERLSSGDLRVRMTQGVAPEFEPIKLKFNDTVAQLEGTIGSVVGAVGTMRVGLNQITVAAGDLSQRTEQQAASLEETVAALSQVVQGVNLTAQSAEDARAAAALAQIEAEKGGGVVAQAVTAMAEIEQSSEKIGRIIGVIDEIAFQTNLLALNAGVEAARAGEAGRGFAVVAQEVRGLAQRSAEAAKEIKDLISTSSTQVAHGVEFVSASGRSLEQIVAQVGGVTTMISQMADGAREQSVALKEVSIAADQMDKVTQQNAAMVEETTAAAQSLSGETDELAALVDGFCTASAQKAGVRPVTRTMSRPGSSPARPVMQMRTAGVGGAAPKTAPENESWEEF